MTNPVPPEHETIEVDLKNPPLAALLAWLWPGAGHLYQGRTGKGILFMVCILSLWFFGLALGEGHSVYASNRTIARKLVFGCQLGVGLPASPALVQAMRSPQDYLWNGVMAPPIENGRDQLSEWNAEYGLSYDMGVLYTMVAGLLNILAILDAYGGPLVPPPDDEKKKKNSDEANTASGSDPPPPESKT
jgi:hypothetical protein